MLVGRGAERAQIDGLIAAARAGESGVLVIRGEPGIGKTALLEYAAERAEGFRVLRAIGVEAESELAYSGIHELLGPVHDSIVALPERQATALRTALALGPPAEIDRFGVYAALLGLLAAVAEKAPLLCLIDDAQWLDTASAEALVFACRRLQAEPIAMLIATRDEDAHTFIAPGLPELRLTGLHEEAARALLAESFDNGLAADVVRRIIEWSGGNPLGLLELPRALTEDERLGHASIDSPVRVSARIENSFVRRLDGLSSYARSALLVAAASDSEELRTIAAAAQRLEIPMVAWNEVEAARLIRVTDGRLHFRHPLVRSAIYGSADPAERRRVHAALAAAYTEPHNADRRAWHLAASAVVPDEEVAGALEQAAELARARGGAAAEARAYERAARLSPDPERRARRLLRAAEAVSVVGGLTRIKDLCREALSLTRDHELRGDIHKVLENTLFWAGELEAAHRIKMEVSIELEPIAPLKAAHMRARATASLTHMLRGSEAVQVGRSAWDLLRRHAGDDVRVGMMYAQALLRLGVIAEGRALARESAVIVEQRGELELRWNVVDALVLLDDYAEADRLLAPSVEASRSRGAFSELAALLGLVAAIERGRGRLLLAHAAASESVELSEQLQDELLQLAMSITELASVTAELGRQEEARRHVARALELSARCGSRLFEARTRAALGALELSLGNAEPAAVELERVAAMVRGGGYRNPAFVQFSPELVEAYMRVGRERDAIAEAARLESEASEVSSPWTLAVAARCRGLVADDKSFEAAFAEALIRHDESPRALERARTELLYGERLRRAGRRVDARVHIRSAISSFDQAGSRLWSQRARAELSASGEHLRGRETAAPDDLTPQELQVALVVAKGASNKEAAAQLFLSPKTIEFHLRNTYRKLGVSSRTQLANAMREGGQSERPVHATTPRSR